MTWSAMLMLLANPIGVQGADCGCSSAHEVSMLNCCCGSDACCGSDSCCESGQTSCCSRTSTCCSTTNGIHKVPCSCEGKCQCGAIDDTQSPNPVIPVNDLTSQQTQILALANQTISGLDGTLLGDEFPRTESVRPLSFSALQKCVLLSRFTC